ncbi:MAG TPA: RHS repeat-associated core domain-containing protein, partial [Polyangia bacterium]|nr:RHS repeat-associated core domain-containing protein [Polyangia bacterium]
NLPTKHIFAGETRIVSKTDAIYMQTPAISYYHPDNLGTTSYTSAANQDLLQHERYFAFGELWRPGAEQEECDLGRPDNLRREYTFTSKEWDVDTSLYYFGARYFDPHADVWQSPDPILAEYMSGSPNGGVFHPRNLGLYTYGWNNPIIMLDPDGLFSWKAAAKGFVKGALWGAAGAVVVTALVASGGTLALVGAGAIVGYGAANTGIAGYEAVSGKEAFTGRELSDDERSETTGSLVGGFVGAAAAGGGARLGRGGRGSSPALRGAASDAASEAQGASPRPGAAGALEADGQTFKGASVKGTDAPTLNPEVQDAYNRVPPEERSSSHGRCAEGQCLSNAMNKGVNPRGGRMRILDVRGAGNPKHGLVKPPCSSCAHVLKQMGVKADHE